jgi:uncharacterized protein YecE (DUF72 family)
MRTKRPSAAVLPEIHIGTAGWSLPKVHAQLFPPPAHGTHLQRYAARLNCAEINSSFYRPHLPATYERWASSVPEKFRFSVKMPRAITHYARLKGVTAELDAFIGQAGALGRKLGVVLVQLPPSLQFDHKIAKQFFVALRRRYPGAIALEPRHATWFDKGPCALLEDCGVSRVAADPAVVPEASDPGGDPQTIYLRLHGSPEVYYSTYDKKRLRIIANRLRVARAGSVDAWCIFDNTARGAAFANALDVKRLTQGE